jgi:hypothetical protein
MSSHADPSSDWDGANAARSPSGLRCVSRVEYSGIRVGTLSSLGWTQMRIEWY